MFQPGLKGITAVETKLSEIDGGNGHLSYRGKEIGELMQGRSFEEIAYFLLNGSLPNPSEYISFKEKLQASRALEPRLLDLIRQLPKDQPMMSVLRTAISAMEDSGESWPLSADGAIKWIARLPSIIAHRYRWVKGYEEVSERKDLNHTANFLYMLFGEEKREEEVKALEGYLILTMEHGLNASTFSARVTTSTQVGYAGALTAALATMQGPLHGGAPGGVIDLLEEIEHEDRIHEVIEKKIMNGEKIMGFGHRVYKTTDPRADALKEVLVNGENQPEWIQLALKTEQETIELLKKHKPGRDLYANVEYYAAAVMKALEIEPELFTAIFSSSRVVGWCAHSKEQSENNVIFRPKAKYIG
ncbi:citrate/2-methylcitrate synthase [Thalassobacillus hwangdonensis]|uniref:Citrate synthase n=1 Tax=Thalassobacillus hwangdonensis TaxID=546108 RepID=A0ABW3KWT7_9BACI